MEFVCSPARHFVCAQFFLLFLPFLVVLHHFHSVIFIFDGAALAAVLVPAVRA